MTAAMYRATYLLLIFMTTRVLTSPFPGTDSTSTGHWKSSMMDAMARAARVLRISSSSSNNNNNANNSGMSNYSVSFVPLFSLIANFLPKLFSRFAAPQGSRSLGNIVDMHKGIFCSPEHVGRWKDLGNCHQFHVCEMNTDAPISCHHFLAGGKGTSNKTREHKEPGKLINSTTEKQMGSYRNTCITVTTYQCQDKFVFNDHEKRCIPETKESKC